MFQHLKPSVQRRKINSVFDTHKHITERLLIDSFNNSIIRDIHPGELNKDFVSLFNQGDTVYQTGVPFASLVKDAHVLYQGSLARGQYKIVERWPEVIGVPGYFLSNNRQDPTHSVIEQFGMGARTKLNTKDFGLWAAYWSILDIFKDKGVATFHNDDRIPERSYFLQSFNTDNWSDEFLNSNSKEDIEQEIRMQMGPKYSVLKDVYKYVDSWIEDEPEYFYSVRFKGPYIIVDRKSDITTLAFHAMRENHPILGELARLNLI